jgi:hypothetical protein
MSNGLLYIAGLISLALAALFAVPYFVDWNGYRGVFEEEASRILGREVRVGGNVNVRLLPSPYVSFEKLRIADPTGSTGEPFFRAESFTMRLSAPPLLKGIIEANEVVLEKPFLRLAVDANGEGNWRSFSVAAGSLPFVPAGLTLQSVKINDGSIAVQGPKGIGFAEVGGLNGELKAESITGPFSFKGIANTALGEREVRFASGPLEADGGVHFKATVRGTAHAANLYVIDARIADLKGHPRIDGELTAKLLLPAEGLAIAAPAAAATGAKAETPGIDFKARIDGDAQGLRVNDIAVSFEHVGQPQLIAGSATASWAETLNIDLAMSSRWLDLDKVAKSPQEAEAPFDTARNFILAMMEALPINADSKVSFDLDQATLGGEAVSGIRVEVRRVGGALLLNTLRAGLPGGTRVVLDGTVAADETAGQAFRGDVTLHGTSLSRFLDWAIKDKELAASVRNEGPFSLQGQLTMTGGSVDLTDAGAEFGGRPVKGEVRYSKKGRPGLAISLEGNEIDAGQLWPAGVAGLKRVLAGDGADPAGKPKFAWLDPAATDLHLRLRAGELITQHGRLRDVDMDIGIEDGRLAVRRSVFTSADNLQVDLEGSVADTLKNPRGSLHWVVAAPNKESFASLVQLFDLTDDSRRQAETLAAFAPLRLAGSVNLGMRQPQSADVSIDGSVQNGGRLVLTALLDGGLDHWRVGPADITATIDSSDVAAVWQGLSARAVPVQPTGSPYAGEIFFKAVGMPSKGMMATASVKAPAMFLGYDGKITLPEDGSRGLDGELRVAARGFGDAMAVAGLGGSASLQEIPVSGALRVVSADHAFELKPRGMTIGGSKIDGSIALSYPSEGPAIVTGEINVDNATVPGLLAFVLDRKQVAEAPGAEPLAAGKTIWPEHSFDFAALDGVEGKLNVGFGTLVLTDRMAVPKARAVLEVAPGKVTVSKLEGKVLGGDLSANVALERAPGGAGFKADIGIGGMQVRAGKDEQASLKLEVSGRASTPGALVSVLTGKGEVRLGDIALNAPTPLAVVSASEAVLNGEAGGSGEQLAAALRAQFDMSTVKIGPRTIAVDVADGAAKLASTALSSEAGTTTVQATVDLASLMIDSLWSVEPRAPDVVQAEKPRHGALPSVAVVYTGPLANLWALDQHVTVEPLERELAIRKMELDADQLERLRKADTERARRDEERRRAVESDETTTVPETPGGQPPGPAAIVPPVPSPVDPTSASGQDTSGQAPPSQGTVPAIPPSSASAAGVAVPPAPGQEGQTFGAVGTAGPIAPAPTEAGSIPATTSPGSAYRRKPQRQVRPNEQVLRNLMNTN